MSETSFPLGQIGWVDLTVADADGVRDFYQQIAGWAPSPVDMGGYEDYCMTPPGAGAPVSGICHARGGNSNLPPVWLIYITVADLDESIRRCLALGGKIRKPTETMGAHGRFCVIEDPAGAAAGLFEASKA